MASILFIMRFYHAQHVLCAIIAKLNNVSIEKMREAYKISVDLSNSKIV